MDRDVDDDLAELLEAVEGDDQSRLAMALAEDDVDGLVPRLNRTAQVQRPHSIDPAIPKELVAYVRSICRADWLVERVLDRASKKVLRRIRNNTPEARQARWSKRWQPGEREQTRRWLDRIRDELLASNHLQKVTVHATFMKEPKALLAWEPDDSGQLIVDDAHSVTPSLGVTSFLEQTPPQVLAWIRETWLRERLGDLDEDVSLEEHVEPSVWDLTAGSGTASDLFGRIHASQVIASDLTIVPAEGVALLDCREIGSLPQHKGARRVGLAKAGSMIRRPDLILFDPPSRGRPTHAELYYGSCPSLDLALLGREEWIVAVAFTVIESVQHLVPGGFVSLLLRCGTRNHGEVQDDAEVLPDLRSVLDDRVRVTHEMPLVFRGRRGQVSLGTNRVPAVHLRIERAT